MDAHYGILPQVKIHGQFDSIIVSKHCSKLEPFRTNIETNTERPVAQCLCNVWPQGRGVQNKH